MALTKNVIVEKLQSELGFPRNKSVEITESILELIKASLLSGDDLMLKPRRVVTFKCSGTLRDKVNGK